jgi:hypothetical protein
MLNLGSNWGDVHWPDQWTATTTDGKRSAQFEDTILQVHQISRDIHADFIEQGNRDWSRNSDQGSVVQLS